MTKPTNARGLWELGLPAQGKDRCGTQGLFPATNAITPRPTSTRMFNLAGRARLTRFGSSTLRNALIRPP